MDLHRNSLSFLFHCPGGFWILSFLHYKQYNSMAFLLVSKAFGSLPSWIYIKNEKKKIKNLSLLTWSFAHNLPLLSWSVKDQITPVTFLRAKEFLGGLYSGLSCTPWCPWPSTSRHYTCFLSWSHHLICNFNLTSGPRNLQLFSLIGKCRRTCKSKINVNESSHSKQESAIRAYLSSISNGYLRLHLNSRLTVQEHTAEVTLYPLIRQYYDWFGS